MANLEKSVSMKVLVFHSDLLFMESLGKNLSSKPTKIELPARARVSDERIKKNGALSASKATEIKPTDRSESRVTSYKICRSVSWSCGMGHRAKLSTAVEVEEAERAEEIANQDCRGQS